MSIGLNFRASPGDIEIQTNNDKVLAVDIGQTLALAGGDLRLEGGKIVSPWSDVYLASVKNNGVVNLISGLYPVLSNTLARGEINLMDAEINVRGGGGGNITLEGENISLLGDLTRVRAGIKSGQGFSGAQAGDIVIAGTGLITIDGAVVSNVVDIDGVGNGGDIVIAGNSLLVSNGGGINGITGGQGNSSHIRINTVESVTITDGFVASQVAGVGNSGGITIETGSLSLEQGGFISASTFARGDSGAIAVKVRDVLVIKGESAKGDPSHIASVVAEKGMGDSGGITLETGSFLLEDGGYVNTGTAGQGNAGNIVIKATDSITIRGESTKGSPSYLASQVADTGVGNSRGIVLETGSLLLEKKGAIDTSTSGKGESGAIMVSVSQGVSITENSYIESRVEKTGSGNSGGIAIETSSLLLKDGRISSSTLSNGNAGNISILATGETSIAGTYFDETLNRDIGGILAFTTTSGTAGSITLTTPTLNLSNRAGIEAFTQGEGNAGNITITVPNVINVGKNSSISVEASAKGQPGNILITTNTLSLENDAKLSATITPTSTNTTGGGSINLNASNLNISGKLGIFAETQGQGYLEKSKDFIKTEWEWAKRL